MSLMTDIVRAGHIGVKNLRDHAPKYMRDNQVYLVTRHGRPTKFLVPYEEMVELMDILDELSDPETLKMVAEGRKAIARGEKAVPAKKVWQRLGI
ncbi:hypothetical protein ES702_04263 [subsurface metagenome]